MPEWITTEEAADLSGYSLQYVQRLARQGHIGAQKKSRTWWVDRDVLASYVRAMTAREDKRAGPRKEQPEETELEAGVAE